MPFRIILQVASVIALTSIPGRAEQAGSTGKIAIIDVAYVFQNASNIKEEVAGIEQQMVELRDRSRERRSQIVGAARELRTLQRGTPSYRQQEENLAALESGLKLQTLRERKSLAEAEARLYLTHYSRMKQIIAQLAEYNGIDLVLRYDSEAMELANPDTVLRGVMKNVVFRSPTIDLTELVRAAMEQEIPPTKIASVPQR